ncbi:Transcriptional regulatory protein CseB [Streptomyces sp. YIM 130001]|uniref:response regulator transcription factor n=1 Tax=Streptomyces sp. YIM 130001 TaxID=2259644 RepID=UPI000EC16F9C|nr:response regulator transcription factor [Streptomyces sp. YIM 130001]RII08669.1 Transcriptional regulatory protein CseB [Streptomyces sp. YIM 130001]
MTPPLRLLLVEDDRVIREATRVSMERHGYEVDTAADGLTALEKFAVCEPDAVALDIMLPHLDGISVLRRIRETSTVPVVMISARGDTVDVVNGLEAGADDYIAKPFDSQILVARLRAVMRRTAPATTPQAASSPAVTHADPAHVFGDLVVDPDAVEVHKNGQRLSLTPTELRLLFEFTAYPGQVLSRPTLLRHVWESEWQGDSRVVDIHIQRLRAKIGPEHIETVRGFGYRLTR